MRISRLRLENGYYQQAGTAIGLTLLAGYIRSNAKEWGKVCGWVWESGKQRRQTLPADWTDLRR